LIFCANDIADNRVKQGETDRFQFVGQIVIQHIEPVFNNRPLRFPDWLTPREIFLPSVALGLAFC